MKFRLQSRSGKSSAGLIGCDAKQSATWLLAFQITEKAPATAEACSASRRDQLSGLGAGLGIGFAIVRVTGRIARRARGSFDRSLFLHLMTGRVSRSSSGALHAALFVHLLTWCGRLLSHGWNGNKHHGSG